MKNPWISLKISKIMMEVMLLSLKIYKEIGYTWPHLS